MKTFEEMSLQSRIWIYSSTAPLTDDQISEIETRTIAFLDEWTSHDQKMHAAFAVRNRHFLILAVDESMAQASGCGIDKSVRHFQHLGESLQIDLFKRTEVFYSIDNQIKSAPIHTFWAMRKAGILSDETLVYDTTVRTINELNTKWLIPFSSSWHQEMWRK